MASWNHATSLCTVIPSYHIPNHISLHKDTDSQCDGLPATINLAGWATQAAGSPGYVHHLTVHMLKGPHGGGQSPPCGPPFSETGRAGLSLHRASQQAAHEVALQPEEHRQWQQEGDEGRRGE